MNSDCPRPDKTAYENRAIAVSAIRHMPKRRKRHAHPYQCVCGAWHLGRRFRRAERKAMR